MSNFSRPPPPEPCYSARDGKPLQVDAAFYERIAATADSSSKSTRKLLQDFEIPPRSGKAWKVPAGGIVRLSITSEGPQVGDFNVWNSENPRERFWASRTRQLQSSHVGLHDRLWSCLPFLRPLCTVIADTLGGEYGTDANGGRCHDLLGTRCDPYVDHLLTGDTYNYHCHSNLVRAVLPHGLNESDVHDVLNVFQVTGLNEKGQYFLSPSPARPNDYIEFFAEQPLLCALSTCPGGDLSAWGWNMGDVSSGDAQGSVDPSDQMKATCRPIHVSVWEIADEEVLKGWAPPKRSQYRGMHGVLSPEGEGSG